MSEPLDDIILRKHAEDTISEDALSFPEQMEVHKAHVYMLRSQGIIQESDARQILKALKEIQEEGPEKIPRLPGLTDLYSNLEEYLIEKIGLDVGGKLHTGRSRNDMNLTIERMYVRKLILACSKSVLTAMKSLLETADEHVKTVLPGYTHHSQHAQPTTLGHYMLWAYYNFERDLERLESCYNHTNICPLGGAALVGTSFDVDRELVSKLLGFDKPITHCADATSSMDFALEAASSMCVLISNIGRISESLLLWSMYETGIVKLAAKYCSYSTIMPQKRNPVAIETLRIEGDWAYGALSSMLNATKAYTPGNGREPGFVISTCIQISQRITNAVYLFAGIISSLDVDKDRCRALADEGFSSMTDLADVMVRDKGLSFSAAKKIVGDLVVTAHRENISCRQITPELIRKSAIKIIGKPVEMSEEEINEILDSEKNINRRKTPGGPGFEQVEEMLHDSKNNLQILNHRWLQKESSLKESSNYLEKLADDLTQN